MPVQRGKDEKGPYYSWGKSGKRYRYKPGSERSRKLAHAKASKQGRAIKARGDKR